MKHFLITILLTVTLFSSKIEDAYIAISQISTDKTTIKKAYLIATEESNKKLSIKEKREFYKISEIYSATFKDCEPINKMKEYYNAVKGKDIDPISIVQIACMPDSKIYFSSSKLRVSEILCKADKGSKQRIELYKKAINEDPRYELSYKILSCEYYESKKYNLAIETLKNGIKANLYRNKLKARFHFILSLFYNRKIDANNSCRVFKKSLLRQAIKEAKATLKIDPDMLGVYTMFTLNYTSLGEEKLALKANKVIKSIMRNDINLQNIYEQTLIENGKKDTYLQMVKDGIDSNSSKNRLMASVYDQNWKEALKYQKLIKMKKFQDFLRYASINYAIGKKEKAKKIIFNIPKKLISSQWEGLLKNNYLNTVSDKQLLQKANTPCQKTEANYYIGVKYLANNKEKAKDYFKKVVDLKVYGYVEYTASKYFLKEGLK